MRRYRTSPSIPFLIARVECLQEPVGSRVSAMEAVEAIPQATDHQNASSGLKTAIRVFLWSLWVAGIAIGAGVALEINGIMHQGLFAQAFGFFVAGVAIIRHPGDENHE